MTLSSLMPNLHHMEGIMVYEEEVVDFIDDSLKGQPILSNPIVGPLDSLWHSNKIQKL